MKWNKQEKKQRILNRSLMLIVAWEWIYRAGAAENICCLRFPLVVIHKYPFLISEGMKMK